MDLPQVIFQFVVEGVSLDTLPLDRLAAYLKALADLFGSANNVHLSAVERGSVRVLAQVGPAAIMDVRERLAEATQDNASAAARSRTRLNQLLADDGASGVLTEDRTDGVVVLFSGIADRLTDLPPFRQAGELRGQLTRLQGGDDNKRGTIRSAGEDRAFECSDAMARLLRHHLWDFVMIQGSGRWRRAGSGEWELLEFKAATFDLLATDSISAMVARIREEGEFEIDAAGAVELRKLREA